MGNFEWLFQHSAKSFPTIYARRRDVSPDPFGLRADACSMPCAIAICCYDPSVTPARIIKPRPPPVSLMLSAALPAGVGHHTSRCLSNGGRRPADALGCQDQQTGA